jgi:hypothetical protein
MFQLMKQVPSALVFAGLLLFWTVVRQFSLELFDSGDANTTATRISSYQIPYMDNNGRMKYKQGPNNLTTETDGGTYKFIDNTPTTGVYSGFYIEEASVLASRSGSTATCTVNIPYSWGLLNGSTDLVALNYTVDAFTYTAASNGQPTRYSIRALPNMHVPANGTTTTINAAVTI